MANPKKGQTQILKCVLALAWFIHCIRPLHSCCYFGEYENQSSESFHQTEERNISCKQLAYVKERKQLDESCEVRFQCSGTKNAGVCGENRTCSCNEGFLKIQKQCLKGNRTLGQSCKHDRQCTGMGDRGIRSCQDGKCYCDAGFIYQKQICLPDKKYELFLVVGFGLVGVLVIFSTVLLLLKMRHSDKNSSKKESKGITIHSVGNGGDASNVSDINYSTTHLMKEESGSRNSQIYIYNHLHEQASDPSETVYDDPNLYAYLSLQANR